MDWEMRLLKRTPMEVLITARSEGGELLAIVKSTDGTVQLTRNGAAIRGRSYETADLESCVAELFRLAGIESFVDSATEEQPWGDSRGDHF